MESRAQRRARKSKERDKKKRARGQGNEGAARGGLASMRRGLRGMAGTDRKGKGRLLDVLTWVAVAVAVAVFAARRCG